MHVRSFWNQAVRLDAALVDVVKLLQDMYPLPLIRLARAEMDGIATTQHFSAGDQILKRVVQLRPNISRPEVES